jgi:hypothetical protein
MVFVKNILLAVGLLIMSVVSNAAGLNVKTNVLWVGQYSNDESFYFGAEEKDTTCGYTETYGHYKVEGTNAKGIYSMLLAAASSGKSVSFSISGCASNERALIREMYYHAD